MEPQNYSKMTLRSASDTRQRETPRITAIVNTNMPCPVESLLDSVDMAPNPSIVRSHSLGLVKISPDQLLTCLGCQSKNKSSSLRCSAPAMMTSLFNRLEQHGQSAF